MNSLRRSFSRIQKAKWTTLAVVCILRGFVNALTFSSVWVKMELADQGCITLPLEIIEYWVYEDGLQPFLTVLGRLVKYDFDSADWDAISSGVSGTSVDDGRWYEYEFFGELTAKLKIAHADGCCLYAIRLEAPTEIRDRIELAISMLNEFKLAMTS